MAQINTGIKTVKKTSFFICGKAIQIINHSYGWNTWLKLEERPKKHF
jgi:hypothetical protein